MVLQSTFLNHTLLSSAVGFVIERSLADHRCPRAQSARCDIVRYTVLVVKYSMYIEPPCLDDVDNGLL